MKTVKNVKKTKLKITWYKVADATHYEVQIARNKKFTKSRDSYTSSTLSAKFKWLTKKKKYYVRVRACAYFNGIERKGAWSKVKKIKITR